MAANVQVQGLMDGVSREQAIELTGSIVQVCFGGENHIPGIVFPLAKVLRVTDRPGAVPCPNCEKDAPKCEIELEWESGAPGAAGTPGCEGCIMGVVVEGAQHVTFGAGAVPPEPLNVQTCYDLTGDE